MNIVRLDENDKFYDYFNIDIIDDVEVITKDGERFTGEIETYGPGNELSIRGTIIDGLREGKWAYYFENGELRGFNEYKKGKLNGRAEEYSKDGKLILKGQFNENFYSWWKFRDRFISCKKIC